LIGGIFKTATYCGSVPLWNAQANASRAFGCPDRINVSMSPSKNPGHALDAADAVSLAEHGIA